MGSLFGRLRKRYKDYAQRQIITKEIQKATAYLQKLKNIMLATAGKTIAKEVQCHVHQGQAVQVKNLEVLDLVKCKPGQGVVRDKITNTYYTQEQLASTLKRQAADFAKKHLGKFFKLSLTNGEFGQIMRSDDQEMQSQYPEWVRVKCEDRGERPYLPE